MRPASTSIDYLRFRTQAEVPQVIEAVRCLYGDRAGSLSAVRCNPLKGYRMGLTLKLADVPVARVDFGGESQRGWVQTDIQGQGCSWVSDWDAVEEIERLPGAEPRRVDIALTTFHREVTYETFCAAHAAGRFNTGGREPNLRIIANSIAHKGRTAEVGSRKHSPRFVRGYEKGYEMALGSLGVTHIDGIPIADIFRTELELKPVAGVTIPWEVVERRDQFFAGSYPYLAEVLPGVETEILLMRPERRAQLALATALEHVRTQWGRAIFTALAAYGGDIGAVMDRICAKEHHPGLVAAGVLMVDHEQEGAL